MNSTPISIDFDLVSGENEIDNNFLNYRPASKSGYKYEDVDGSGTLDGGDLALENWEITLTGTDGGGNAVNQVTSTNANGYYEFTNLVPGSYTVTETLQAGWVNSTPISIDFDLVSGENEIDNNFLNYRPASKSGYKYEDVDGSGTLDGGDLALENWEITLTGTDGGGNAVNQVTSTNANGYYEFTNLVPGSYTVTETLQAGWVNSTPISIDFDLVSGENEIDNNFLNYRPASKSGYKYEDVDGSGTLDGGDLALENWEITLTGTDGGGNAVNQVTSTNANGYYEFTNLVPGSYTVTETLQAGWVNSTPISIDFDLVSGENEIDNNFLNYRPASKSGYKYEDVDGSGTLDGGDLALENWEITLTGTDGGGNAVNQVTSTIANGYYEFTNLVPGSYTVTETLQAGWVNSTPISIDFDLVSGENEIDNNFLNYRPASKSGYKYEDVDGSGTLDGGDLALENWEITLTGTDGGGNAVNQVTSTNANGSTSSPTSCRAATP